MMNLFEHK